MSVSRSLVFQIVGRFHRWSLHLRMLGKGLQLKTTALLVFFLWSVKSLKNLNRIVDHLEKCGLFSDFQYGFRSSRSTADLLTVVFDRIARAFNKSGATRAVALDISKAFDRVWHAGLLHKLSLMDFQVRNLALFFLFSVIDGFECFWMESLHKNIQLMLEFLKVPFLVLHFSYYTLMTFLMMLSVILLSMLMILLSVLSVIRHLICGNNLNWLLNLTLILEKLWTGEGSDLLISMLGKLNWLRLTGLITLVLLMWKWMGLFLRKNHLLRCWGWLSLLNWTGVLTLSLLLKLPLRKLEPWFVLWSFFLRRLLCISINLPYDHVWNTVVTSGLVPLVATWNCRQVAKTNMQDCFPSLAASLEPLAHRGNVASRSLFYRYYFGRCSSELAQLVPLPFSRGRSTRYSYRLHDFTVTLPRCYKDVYVNSFFPRTSRLWNSLPIKCFPLTYNLNGFKSRINRHLLTVGSF